LEKYMLDIFKTIVQFIPVFGNYIVRKIDNNELRIMFKKNNDPFYSIMEGNQHILDIFVNEIENHKNDTCCLIESENSLQNLNVNETRDILIQLEEYSYLELHGSIGTSNFYAITLSNKIIYCISDLKYSKKVKKLESMVDDMSPGQELQGHDVKEKLGLPLPIIDSYFKKFKKTKNGLVSDEVGQCMFRKM